MNSRKTSAGKPARLFEEAKHLAVAAQEFIPRCAGVPPPTGVPVRPPADALYQCGF